MIWGKGRRVGNITGFLHISYKSQSSVIVSPSRSESIGSVGDRVGVEEAWGGGIGGWGLMLTAGCMGNVPCLKAK